MCPRHLSLPSAVDVAISDSSVTNILFPSPKSTPTIDVGLDTNVRVP
jgi:hypothetical protein